MQFDSDEAIQLLRSCAVLTAEPHLFLRDMLGGTAPKMPRIERGTSSARPVGWFDRVCAWAEAVARFGKNSYAWLSDTWNRPVCRFAEGVTRPARRTGCG